MDLLWSKSIGIVGLLMMSQLAVTTSSAGKSPKSVDAAILIAVGISDKPLPSILVKEEGKSDLIQREWLQKRPASGLLRVEVSADKLKNIANLLKQKLLQKDLNGKPFGTYLAVIWNEKIATEYILDPTEAQTMLSLIKEYDLQGSQQQVLQQAIGRISQVK